MIRVLHLVDQQADFESERGVLHLCRETGQEFSTNIQTVGRGRTWGGLAAGVRALRKLAETDVVHAWGPRALAAAVLAGRGKVVYSPPVSVDERSARWLRAVMQY